MQAQVDFGYFGPPEEHTQWTGQWGKRVGTYITPDNPSSEICGEVAAAFSAASIALKATDPVYSGKQLCVTCVRLGTSLAAQRSAVQCQVSCEPAKPVTRAAGSSTRSLRD